MIAAVRLRGDVPARQPIRDTLRLLNMKKVNTCVLFDETPSVVGMFRKATRFIAWGPVHNDTVKILQKKGDKVFHLSPPTLKSKRALYPVGDAGYRDSMDDFILTMLGQKPQAKKAEKPVKKEPDVEKDVS